MAALSAIRRGYKVVWWDFEDKPETLAARAAVLGGLDLATDPCKLMYLTPAVIEDPEALTHAITWLGDGLLVLDAAESAGCASDGSSVTEWFTKHITPWRTTCADEEGNGGATVLLIDHVPKRPQGRPRGPIGSQHKLARVDGCALKIAPSAGGAIWTKRDPGTIYAVVDKDRPGDLPARGQIAAVIHGSYDHEGAFKATISSPSEAAHEGGEDTLQDELLRALAAKGPEGVVGARALRSLV